MVLMLHVWPWLPQANLFFVPTYADGLIGNLGDPSSHLERILNHINATFPFFARRQGRELCIVALVEALLPFTLL